ncbi:SDR family oxidoreductase [Ehrlichia ruminantium]|uniref:SDR family oxidoreductase n=1 Tax=Ehrlichia ruminantium TaxID=779 RepID=A0AAE6Q9C7_EHRRU|nr:SDR family oxidoreductase [Ehrlichia ruminantium]QGR02757.1 SDR family oxidoreductase [Ehrlichia ruminantium]QGR03677.1 SDR family oxidoreductase [Ehrlichia ruminantium]QGR04604.1 SDR family oxidoreductase [Ehrlichia ruminantium]
MHLFCFGYGYTASFLAQKLLSLKWKVSGTSFHQKKQQNENVHILDYNFPLPESIFADITHVLISIPPEGDDILKKYHIFLQKVHWVGYLSATNVYGDHNGNWVNETSITNPSTNSGIHRLKQEKLWLNSNLPIHIFRLSGIYGPQRNVLCHLIQNNVRYIISDTIFSRIHVDDIANILFTSIHHPNPNSIYNCSDDLPASYSNVVKYGAQLLNIDPPKPITFDDLPDSMKRFYTEKKLVSNLKIKDELGISLKYPTYIQGLHSLINTEIF